MKTVALREVIASSRSGFASGKRDTEGTIQLRMNNVSRDGILSLQSVTRVPASKKQLEQLALQEGDVLFNGTNSPELVGKTCLFRGHNEPVVFSNHFIRLCSDQSRLQPGYLARWLTWQRAKGVFTNGCVRWVNQATYKKEDLLSLQIPLPPLPEQKRIAAILDSADALRSKRRESIEQLDSLVQATFLEMFGDPVTNPKGWPTPSGSKISTRIKVGIVVKPASYYRPFGVPAFRSLNIRPHRIDATDLVYVSEADNTGPLKKSRVRLNDILIVRSGQPGTAAVVTPEFDGVNAIDIIIMSPDLSRVHPAYVCCYLNSDGGKRMVGGAERGQIQKHFNVGSLNAAPIPLPPLDLQTRFASVVESIEQQKARQKAHLTELDALFASLQSRAFNGELVA